MSDKQAPDPQPANARPARPGIGSPWVCGCGWCGRMYLPVADTAVEGPQPEELAALRRELATAREETDHYAARSGGARAALADARAESAERDEKIASLTKSLDIRTKQKHEAEASVEEHRRRLDGAARASGSLAKSRRARTNATLAYLAGKLVGEIDAGIGSDAHAHAVDQAASAHDLLESMAKYWKDRT